MGDGETVPEVPRRRGGGIVQGTHPNHQVCNGAFGSVRVQALTYEAVYGGRYTRFKIGR